MKPLHADRLKAVSIILLSGSIANDFLLIPNNTASSLAKILFITGALLFFITGMSIRRLNKVDLAICGYSLFLITSNAVFAISGPNIILSNATLSIVLGLSSYFIFAFGIESYEAYFFRSFSAWATINNIFGIIQAFTGMLFISDRKFTSIVISNLYRSSGLLSDPNYYALFCLISIPIIKISRFRRKVTENSLIGLCYLGILLSGSRSGIIILILFLFYKWLSNAKSKFTYKKTLVIIAIAATLFAGASTLLPDSISNIFRPEMYSESAPRSSLSDRAIAALAAWNVGKENPVFGYGLGNFIHHPYNTHSQLSHNTYLEIFAESGITGLLALLILFIITLRTIYKSPINRTIRTDTTLALLSMAFMSLFLVTHYSRIFYFVFAFVSAITSKYFNQNPERSTSSC